jgi:esterase
MERRSFRNDGVTLSFLDAGGEGRPLIALHAYWMEAGTYADLASAMAPAWRVIALDLRGHGRSDHPADLSWEAFLDDLSGLVAHLEISTPLVLAGNSFGGAVAFRHAARHPRTVAAMVIEETPAVLKADLDFMRAWAGTYPTREALLAKVGERLAWSVEPSIRKTDAGWTLAFSPNQLADALAGLNGDFWPDWTATTCPVLLARGSDSKAVDGDVLRQMAERRPNVELVTFDAGHVIHHDAPEAFAETTRRFLAAHCP